jgi:hypothetical protein
MPVKKKVKKIKLKVGRGARASRPPTKKPNVKQVVNVFTTRAEPFRTDFRDQYRYGLGFTERDQTPFQPVFNYIQPQIPTKVVEEKKVEITEPKPKRTYRKKPVAIGVSLAEPLSRQSSTGYESEFMPFETEMERRVIQKQADEEKRIASARTGREYITGDLNPSRYATSERQPSSGGEFFSGELSPVVETKRRGRPAGSKSKPKEVGTFTLPKPIGQTDISQFFSKVGGSSKTPVFMEEEEE